MCGCEQGTCPGNCPCGCTHTAPTRLDGLVQAAEATTALRQINPMNGDGSNYMLDKVIQVLDRLAGNHEPSRAAAMAWAVRMDQYEDEYCRMHNMPRSKRTHVEQLEAKWELRRRRLTALDAAGLLGTDATTALDSYERGNRLNPDVSRVTSVLRQADLA